MRAHTVETGNVVDDMLREVERELAKPMVTKEDRHSRACELLNAAFRLETFVERKPPMMHKEQIARALGLIARANVIAGLIDPSRVML